MTQPSQNEQSYSVTLVIRYQENHMLEKARSIPHVAANAAMSTPYFCLNHKP